MANLIYQSASSENDMRQIISLQTKNLEKGMDSKVLDVEGFVTCVHSEALLLKMNQSYPHSIVLFEDCIIAYALVLLPSFKNAIDVLKPMFNKIEQLTINNNAINAADYFVMGQICIDEQFRKQGVFRKMYKHLFNKMKLHFDYCITEVAIRNNRSLQAHIAIGFNVLHKYEASNEDWAILVYDMRA